MSRRGLWWGLSLAAFGLGVFMLGLGSRAKADELSPLAELRKMMVGAAQKPLMPVGQIGGVGGDGLVHPPLTGSNPDGGPAPLTVIVQGGASFPDGGTGSDTTFAILHGPDGGDWGTTSQPVRVDPTGTTTQPVSGTFWQATQPISAASLPLPTSAATDRTTAAAPFACRISADGTNFTDATHPINVAGNGPLLPGTNITAAPTASASDKCTSLTAGGAYWLTCDQDYRMRQCTSSTCTAVVTDFGPVAAKTVLHGRLGASDVAVAYYNLGSSTANCSCAPDVP